MLGSSFAVTRPTGLHHLIIADSLASRELWVEAGNRLIQELPKEVRDALLKHEREGTTASVEYGAASMLYIS